MPDSISTCINEPHGRTDEYEVGLAGKHCQLHFGSTRVREIISIKDCNVGPAGSSKASVPRGGGAAPELAFDYFELGVCGEILPT